jgi:hypothetical protein
MSEISRTWQHASRQPKRAKQLKLTRHPATFLVLHGFVFRRIAATPTILRLRLKRENQGNQRPTSGDQNKSIQAGKARDRDHTLASARRLASLAAVRYPQA